MQSRVVTIQFIGDKVIKRTMYAHSIQTTRKKWKIERVREKRQKDGMIKYRESERVRE